MVSKIARIHLQPENVAGVARAGAGWIIAVLGMVLLVVEAFNGLARVEGPLRDALLGGAMAAGATALGAVPLLVTRRIGDGAQGALLGFGAGVMLAASVFSLLVPGFEAARAQGADALGAAHVVAAGVALGASALLVLDRSLPHSHAPDTARSAHAVWLFVLAIAVHNIPEGLAIGVAAGTAGSGNAVATGISLQNVPEGLIVAIALASAGYGRALAFAVAAASGLVEPVAAVTGSLVVAEAAAMLPWGLAAAAGAMMFVVVHEIIPESRRRGHVELATLGLAAGFVAMLLLDGGLG
jgi:ZIP family zinc transporter